MNDLEVRVENKPGEITFNFDEIKEALTAQMEVYKSLQITEDGIKEAKADVATLRKIKDAIESKRKEVKKASMLPYSEFEAKVKELVSIIDEPIDLITKKLDEFETARKKEREVEVKKIYEDTVGVYSEYLPYDRLFKEKWLNKTTKDKEIEDEILTLVINVTNDLAVIRGLKSEIEDDLIKLYKSTNSLSAVIQRNTDYTDAQRRAKEKVEAEAKAAEIEKAKAEARAEAMQEIEKAQEPEEVPQETPKDEETRTFIIHGKESIENVRQYLNFADIEYEEV